MREFEKFRSPTAHVPERQIPYQTQWVRQAHEIAGKDLDEPLSGDTERTALAPPGAMRRLAASPLKARPAPVPLLPHVRVAAGRGRG